MKLNNILFFLVLCGVFSLAAMNEKDDENTYRHTVSLLLFLKESSAKIEIENNVYEVAKRKVKLQDVVENKVTNPFCRYNIKVTTDQIVKLEEEAQKLVSAWNIFPTLRVAKLINTHTDLKIPFYNSLSMTDIYVCMKMHQIIKNSILGKVETFCNFDTDELDRYVLYSRASAQVICTLFLGAFFIVVLGR